MAIRVNKLLREANIGMQTLSEMLSALGVSEPDINPNTKISDDVANLVLGLCYKDIDLLTLIEESARKNVTYDQQGTKFSLTQLLRFCPVFLANQRFALLICFTVFYKF